MKTLKLSLIAVCLLSVRGFAFNLWTDIEQNTQWTLGSSVQAGTAVAMRSDASTNVQAGQFVGSALASIADYRFLDLSAGGTFIPQPTGGLKALDTAKIGINLGYLLKGFTNQPPDVIKNLVFGPSLTTTLVSTPHVFIPFFDINYAWGGSSAK